MSDPRDVENTAEDSCGTPPPARRRAAGRRFRFTAVACAVAAGGISAGAFAQTTTRSSASPATTSQPAGPLPAQSLVATVTGVEGVVQVRTAEDQPWQKCTVGMVLGEGAEFRTGLRSAVRFAIPPDQTITLDRLGTVKLLQAVVAQGKVTTDLGMKYGRTRYQIEAAGVDHVSTIRSPNSTLAVRGTTVALTDQRPFPPEAVSLTGTAQYSTAKRELLVGGKGTGKATAVGDLSPADAALLASVVDPSTPFARTAAETQLVASVISRGGVVAENRGTGIPIVTGGVPPTDAQLLPTLNAPLDFILRWTGNANLDLYVNAPADKTGRSNFLIYPAPGLNVAPNGAFIPFDHRGGPNGGFEVAEFPAPVVPGKYVLGVNFVSGQPTPLVAESFLNGQPVKLTKDLFTTQIQLTGVIGPRPKNINFTGAIALVGIKSVFGGATTVTSARLNGVRRRE